MNDQPRTLDAKDFAGPCALMTAINFGELPVRVTCGRHTHTVRPETVRAFCAGVLMATDPRWEERKEQ